jgi:nicotinate phosphoribosyltransferase
LGQRLPKSIFGGTSNAYFAFKHGNDLSGTMAHELIQAGQSIDNVELKNSQKYMLEKWLLEFNGKLSIALTDTLGLDKFLRDFDFNLSSSYAGVRHDSGDPIEWAYKMIKHYDDFNISSIDKTFVFSDGLDFNKIININNLFKDKANLMFGVGTNLTNDFEEVTPLQIVIKMIGCNGKLVAKLSDNPIKTMCKDNNYLNILKDAIKE